MKKNSQSRLIIGLMLIILSLILGQKGLLSDSVRGLIIGIGIGFLIMAIYTKSKDKKIKTKK